jgi:hypothetical protein
MIWEQTNELAMTSTDPNSRAERRTEPRRMLSMPACVIAQDKLFLCEVLDCSSTGARLGFDRAIFPAGTIKLYLDDPSVEITCDIVWRRGLELGVRFADRVYPLHADCAGHG